ncbi:MAG: Asp-tRNA(Asn)/Glu-tRNA(Gln) amidotransferase subunit GatB [Ignavibacteriales bacterium]|nr:Asp-tRNA(Asn)/Glu-tRNA(Gln) amidotransferase subunit GatB [Ignavibacteriales bacterium]MCB9219189.1 Asp-tRNA(Asn)/Glu-tRNA(Gln) amidotransferase subunit GatB [Ignavibacteriales bacterium]
MEFEAVIGLEVHAQLLTDTKIFCGCSTKFGNPANSNVCPVCLGHPGVLPVLNKKVVEFTTLMGLATNCTINEKSVFARKNYFYPDLPKGYQISQFELPICENGYIDIKTNDEKRIRIKRIHMEEDAGKSIHDQGYDTLVDVNRCGTPLIEIVSEPDISSGEEAYQYLSNLKQIITYLGICDGNMEEGSLRCDANISIRPKGATELGTRTEVKNMNSFRNVQKAIDFEIDRQINLVEDGGEVIQQTLLWNAEQNKATSMRGKEEAHDYRYFPDPDLMPVIVDEAWQKEIFITMPELPVKRKERFIKDLNLPEYDAEVLTSQREMADFYEEVLTETNDSKIASNWVMGDVLKIINEQKKSFSNFPVSPKNLGKLINLINQNKISSKIAKDVFPFMLEEDRDPEIIVKEKNLIQITDTSAIESAIDNVINQNPDQVEEFKSGKDKVIGFFVGQVMKETKGKANPQMVNQILREKLK